MVLLCLGLLICISSDSCFAGSLLAYRSSTRSNQATCFPSHLPHHCYSDGFRPNADDVAACRSLFVQRKQVFASGIKVLPPSHSAHHLNPNTPAAASLTLASSLWVTNLWPFLSRRELRCALAAAPCCAVTHSHSSLPMQLLKKGSTGLVVGNARASICAISGAARLHGAHARHRRRNRCACSVRASDSRRAVSSRSRKGAYHNACNARPAPPSTSACTPDLVSLRQLLDYLNENIGKQGAGS